jgi:predicted transposase YbfD/YdcC
MSLFATKNQSVINQIKMEKGENEVTAAIRFINETEIEGAIITGDAMFAQKKSAKRL